MIRGVEVGSEYQTDQRSFDGILKGGPAASGMGDLTREQIKEMARQRNRQFLGQVMLLAIGLFGATYVIIDVSGVSIPLPF